MKNNNLTSKQIVFELIAKIPSGKVSTYGHIGRAANVHPRVVGTYLHQNTDPDKYPCHRVVNHQGSLAPGYVFGGSAIQRKRLDQEGVLFINDRVDLKQHLWIPPERSPVV